MRVPCKGFIVSSPALSAAVERRNAEWEEDNAVTNKAALALLRTYISNDIASLRVGPADIIAHADKRNRFYTWRLATRLHSMRLLHILVLGHVDIQAMLAETLALSGSATRSSKPGSSHNSSHELSAAENQRRDNLDVDAMNFDKYATLELRAVYAALPPPSAFDNPLVETWCNVFQSYFKQRLADEVETTTRAGLGLWRIGSSTRKKSNLPLLSTDEPQPSRVRARALRRASRMNGDPSDDPNSAYFYPSESDMATQLLHIQQAERRVRNIRERLDELLGASTSSAWLASSTSSTMSASSTSLKFLNSSVDLVDLVDMINFVDLQ